MKTNKNFNKLLVKIGAHLAILRQKKGYPTIKEFVVKYELPEIQYWRVEKGKTNITIKSLMKILEIHKISVQDFFCMVADEKVWA